MKIMTAIMTTKIMWRIQATSLVYIVAVVCLSVIPPKDQVQRKAAELVEVG